jgi:rhodanese-related sulfurtransferase
MSTINTISADKLVRLVGTPKCPSIIDVRTDDEVAADSRLVPSSVRRDAALVAEWADEFAGENAIVLCRTGSGESPGAAAWLRQSGIPADTLEGGFEAWTNNKLATVPEARLPGRDALGRTVWVTRERPKVDRIACPWLIRRFVDPRALFLYVAPSDVESVARQFGAASFDIEGGGVFWSHRDDRCTFDVMVEELGLAPFEALQHLAVIVRGADTGQPQLIPEAAGLLAMSLGLSRMFPEDLEQLEAGMLLYDAFYRWCRDATGETHNWTSHKPKVKR